MSARRYEPKYICWVGGIRTHVFNTATSYPSYQDGLRTTHYLHGPRESNSFHSRFWRPDACHYAGPYLIYHQRIRTFTPFSGYRFHYSSQYPVYSFDSRDKFRVKDGARTRKDIPVIWLTTRPATITNYSHHMLGWNMGLEPMTF